MPESADYSIDEGTAGVGPPGESGDFGGGITIKYVFSTTTTDSDPGNGVLRLDNSTQNAATVIRADLLDSGGASWGPVLIDIANAVTGVTAVIRLVKRDDFTRWIAFLADQVNPETGYDNIFGNVVGYSHTNPFADGDEVVLMTASNGAPGQDGGPGSDGAAGKTLLRPDIQVFQATGANTWTKPTPPMGYSLGNVTRHLIAGGAQGGSGRRGAAGSARGGGGGGGGGGYSSDVNDASLFNATETVTVGAGGNTPNAVTTDNTSGTAGANGGDTTMTGGAGAGTLTASGGTGGGAGTTSGGSGGAGGSGNVQSGASGGAGSATTGLAGDGGEVTTGLKNAGGGGGGGAGINSSNNNTTTGGYGGASAGGRTSRTLGLLGAAVANCLPHVSAYVGNSGPAFMAGTTPVAYGGGGGGGGANCTAYATAFCGSAAGGPGGKYGGGGGGGAGYTNGITVSNDGFFGADGIAIIVTEFI